MDNPSHWLSYFSRWLKPPTRYCWSFIPSYAHCILNQPYGDLWAWHRMLIEIEMMKAFITHHLVGGLEPCFYFPYIGKSNPNWLIFFRGVETTNQFIIHHSLALHMTKHVSFVAPLVPQVWTISRIPPRSGCRFIITHSTILIDLHPKSNSSRSSVYQQKPIISQLSPPSPIFSFRKCHPNRQRCGKPDP